MRVKEHETARKSVQAFNIALHYHVDYVNHFLGAVIILQDNYNTHNLDQEV